MFDGVPGEHFHRFISTPAAAASSRIPPNSSSHIIQTVVPSSISSTNHLTTTTSTTFLSFDPLLVLPPLHHHHHQTLNFHPNHFVRTPPTHDPYHDHHDINEGKTDDQEIDLGLDINHDSTWSNDEVIQLLRIKSSSENWFKDLSWDHVSRKLAEMGYKQRSSEKCKEKFEEETCRSFSSAIGYNKSSSSRYLITEELDDDDEHLCTNNSDQITNHHHITIESPDHQNVINIDHQQQPQAEQETIKRAELQHDVEEEPIIDDDHQILMAQVPISTEELAMMKRKKSKKRKRKHKMVKGLCVELVNKMMAQQEEMHKKLLQDMANRDEEKKKMEEAWRNEEMERVKREIQMREHEQDITRERQSTITQFLNKITTSFDNKKIDQIPFNMTSTTSIQLQDLQATIQDDDQVMMSSSSSTAAAGKRWPRDEVLALINVRSNVNINGDQEGGGRGCLWERISQGMLDLGYERSAKRCKEKWENINKYFRKTKDLNNNKKRSLESRTCPYYHELTKIYNQHNNPSLITGITPEN